MVETATRRLQVTVLDSDPTGGMARRLFSRIVLRNAAAPPLLLSLRDRVEHTALLGYAAAAAGTATPRLLAVGELVLPRLFWSVNMLQCVRSLN